MSDGRRDSLQGVGNGRWRARKEEGINYRGEHIFLRGVGLCARAFGMELIWNQNGSTKNACLSVWRSFKKVVTVSLLYQPISSSLDSYETPTVHFLSSLKDKLMQWGSRRENRNSQLTASNWLIRDVTVCPKCSNPRIKILGFPALHHQKRYCLLSVPDRVCLDSRFQSQHSYATCI